MIESDQEDGGDVGASAATLTGPDRLHMSEAQRTNMSEAQDLLERIRAMDENSFDNRIELMLNLHSLLGGHRHLLSSAPPTLRSLPSGDRQIRSGSNIWARYHRQTGSPHSCISMLPVHTFTKSKASKS